MRKQQRTRSALAERVRQQRRELGLTQSALAARSGLSLGMIEKIEGDTSLAGMRTLRKLAPTLGLDLGELATLATSSAPAATASKRPRRRGTPRRRENIRGGGPGEPTPTFPSSSPPVPATEDGASLPPPDLTHEETGDWYSAQQNWHVAEFPYLLAAQRAAQRGDGVTWAHCLVRAGSVAMCLGRFDDAQGRMEQVASRPCTEIGVVNAIDARLNLGWLALEQGSYRQAVNWLNAAVRMVMDHRHRDQADLTGVFASTLHFLGRSEVAWGMRDPARAALVQKGVRHLEQAGKLSAQESARGYQLLHQLLPLAPTLSAEERQHHLDQSRDLLGDWGTAVGHIHLHVGLLRRIEGEPMAAQAAFEAALAGYRAPVFYPTGVARALQQLGELQRHAGGDRQTIQTALASLLAAAILHPYGEPLAALKGAVTAERAKLDKHGPTFAPLWSVLRHDRVWQMEGPFAALRQLGAIHDGSGAMETIERALTRIDQVIKV